MPKDGNTKLWFLEGFVRVIRVNSWIQSLVRGKTIHEITRSNTKSGPIVLAVNHAQDAPATSIFASYATLPL